MQYFCFVLDYLIPDGIWLNYTVWAKRTRNWTSPFLWKTLFFKLLWKALGGMEFRVFQKMFAIICLLMGLRWKWEQKDSVRLPQEEKWLFLRYSFPKTPTKSVERMRREVHCGLTFQFLCTEAKLHVPCPVERLVEQHLLVSQAEVNQTTPRYLIRGHKCYKPFPCFQFHVENGLQNHSLDIKFPVGGRLGLPKKGRFITECVLRAELNELLTLRPTEEKGELL